MNEIHPLKWLEEAGVTDIASEKPKNFFDIQDTISFSNKTTIPKPKPAVTAKPVSNVASLGFSEVESSYDSLTDIINNAKKLANEANNLDELRKAVESFNGCGLKKTANKTVFSDGNPDTKVMLIGEAPGADEDRAGLPFVGMSGQLLDKVLRSVGLTRESGFYITNTIFWRPPGNRKPTPEELSICKPFLEKHIALVQPKILLLVGATAVQAILQDNSSMTKLRGKTYKYSNDNMDYDTEVMVTYHPSYLMRSPLNKRLAWQDMLMFDEKIKELS